MNKTVHKPTNEIRFLVVNYLFSPTVGFFFCLLEALGRIKLIHFYGSPSGKKN